MLRSFPGTRAIGLIAAIGMSSSALASAPPLELSWQAPAGCPDGAAILHYITKVVGNAEPTPSTMRAQASIARLAADRWMADLTVQTSATDSSTRTFEGPTCEAVAEAAALVVALAMHPGTEPTLPPSFHKEPE